MKRTVRSFESVSMEMKQAFAEFFKKHKIHELTLWKRNNGTPYVIDLKDARLIVENLDDIRKFVNKYSVVTSKHLL